MATTAAVIVAAGRGTRARAPGEVPKQYLALAGTPVLAHSLRMLTRHPQVALTIVVYNPKTQSFMPMRRPRSPIACPRRCPERRPARARCWPAWKRLAPPPPDHVLIHDAARPFLTADLITRLIAALAEQRAPSRPSQSATH